MADETTQSASQSTSAGQGTAGGNAQSSSANGAGDGAPQYATKEEIDLLRKRLDEQSGVLGGINSNIQKLLKPAKSTETAKDPTLTERVDSIEQMNKAAHELLKTSSIQAVAMGAGVPEARAERFAKIVLGEFGENIQVIGGKVKFKESDEKTVGIGEWVSAYLKTADGEFFLPPKATGNSDGQNGSNGSASQPHPYLAMTFDQIMTDKKNNPDQFMSYLEKHGDDWAKKQKTFRL